jgi:hypothetical protein
VAHVGALGGLGRVEIDVDDVVERAHRDADGLAELLVVERAVGLEVMESRMTEPRLQTAVSSLDVFSVISVQRLEEWMTPAWSCGERTLQGSLKVIHGWPVSKSIESIFFQSSRASILCPWILPSSASFLVVEVELLELLAVGLVQIGHLVGAEERPGAAGLHALHEQVGIQLAVFMSWVRRRSSPVLRRSSRNSKMSLCQDLEVGAAGALALAALVDGDELVVVELEEGDDALDSPLVPAM